MPQLGMLGLGGWRWLGGAPWRQCQAGLTAAKLGVGRHGQAASTLGGMRPVAVVLVCLLELGRPLLVPGAHSDREAASRC